MRVHAFPRLSSLYEGFRPVLGPTSSAGSARFGLHFGLRRARSGAPPGAPGVAPWRAGRVCGRAEQVRVLTTPTLAVLYAPDYCIRFFTESYVHGMERWTIGADWQRVPREERVELFQFIAPPRRDNHSSDSEPDSLLAGGAVGFEPVPVRNLARCGSERRPDQTC